MKLSLVYIGTCHPWNDFPFILFLFKIIEKKELETCSPEDNNEAIFISAFLGDNPDQALATSVYSKVVGTSSENNEIKLDVDGYGLINASEAVRFRN